MWHQRGWQGHFGKLAGDSEQLGAQVDATRAFDAYVVGVEWAAGDLLFQVRVADEALVAFGVGAVDTAQERPDIALECAGEVACAGDADVAGHVDRPASCNGHIEHFNTIGVGDHVGARGGYVDPDTDPREADLVTLDRLLGGECRFDRRAVAEVDATGGVDDCSVGSEPERFVREVGGEDDGLGIVEHTRRGQQRAHV